ncbi:hypothetical protein QTP88_008053 [Uroleucon formosanum]
MDKWLNRATDNKSTSENYPVSSASKLESASQDVNNPMKKRKCLRKYDPEYINIGFTVIDFAAGLKVWHALNVKEKLIDQVKNSDFFSIQLDESTDVSNYAQLMVYVRYVFQTVIKEDFLFCEALSTRTTADEIFKKLNHFFVENGLNWKKCVGFCSDGARAMTGKHGGVATKIKLVTENCTFIHCSIHREALIVKRMPEQFKLILQEAIKVVNFIKSRALQSRLFTKLYSEMGSDHIQLLLHTELFLGETNFELKDKLTDNLWITTLAYLSDIFNRLNVLNLSLQGKSINRFSMNDKIKAFLKIIEMISNNVSNENLQSFPNLEQFVTEHELQVEADLRFILDLDDIPKTLTNNEKESLIELSCDESLKMEFTKLELGEFWIKIKNEYPLLSKKALFLLPFTTTYLCETGFSSMIEGDYKSQCFKKSQFLPNNIEIDPLTVRFEWEVLYDQCQNKSTISDLAIVSHKLKNALPLANLLYHLSCTAPVTITGKERSFSKLKIVKNFLRTTQEDGRLHNLMLLSSEKDLYTRFAIAVSP